MAACRKQIDNQLVGDKRVTRSSRKTVSISCSSHLNERGKALQRSAYTSNKLRETEEQEKAIKTRNVYVRCPKLHLENRCMLLKDIPSSAKLSNLQANEIQWKATLSGKSNRFDLTRRENMTCNDGPSFGIKKCNAAEDDVLSHKNAYNERISHNVICSNKVVISANKRMDMSRQSGEYNDQDKLCLNHNKHNQVSMSPRKIDSFASTTSCLNTQNEEQGQIVADIEMDSIPKIISAMTRLVEAVESTVQSSVTTTATTSTVKSARETTKSIDSGEDPVKERIFNALTKFFCNLKTKKNEQIQEQNYVQECEPDSTASATNDELKSNLPIPSSDATPINCDTPSSNATQVVFSTTNLSGTQMNEHADLLATDETTSLSDLKLMCSEDEPHEDTDTDLLNVDPCDATKTNDISIAAKVTAVPEPTKERVDLNVVSSLTYQSKNEGNPQVIEINSESCISADASYIDADQQTIGDDRSASTLDTEQQIGETWEETQILVNNNIPDTDEASEYSEVHDTVDEIISSLEAADETDVDAFQNVSNIDQKTVEENSRLLAPKGSNKKKPEPRSNNNTQNSGMTHSRSEAITECHLSDSESDEEFASPSKVDAILLESIQSIKQSKSRTTLKNTVYTSTEVEDTSSDESLQNAIAASYTSNQCSASKSGSKTKLDANERRKQQINTRSKQLNVFPSEGNDLSSSSDDDIIDLTKSDDTEPRKNRFELELQIIKELIKEKLTDPSHAQVGNVKSSKSTPANDTLYPNLRTKNTSNQKKKRKASQSTPVEPEYNKTTIKMITAKVTPKKRSVEDTFAVSSLGIEYSSDEGNLASNEPNRKKKLSILDNIPAATETKVAKKDNIKAKKDNVKAKKDNIKPLPKTLSSKVKSVLSAGETDVPSVSKKSKNKKKTVDSSSSPEKIWKSLSVFDFSNEGSSIASKKEYKPKSIHACTDFVVQPLNIKNQKAFMEPEHFSSTALDFKRKSIFNDKIRRESSKDLLKRKIRKKF